MNKKRISNEMNIALNEQITKEALAAQVFLSYGSWADVQGFPGIAEFFYTHADEEREHMMKLLKYVNTRGGEARIDAIPAAPENPKTLKECFERALKHEMDNSAAINILVDLAHEEKDWATFNFLQWFVAEQIEEETLTMELIDKYNLASEEENSDNSNWYELDKDLSKTEHAAG